MKVDFDKLDFRLESKHYSDVFFNAYSSVYSNFLLEIVYSIIFSTNLALKTLEEKKFAKCRVSLCMREFLELPPLDLWRLVDNAETIRNMGSLFQHGSENIEERDSDKSGFLKWLVEGIFFNKLMMCHHLSNLL